MGEQYPYYTRREKNIVVVLHIYGTLAIFLLFCDHQDTEYESREMKNGVSGPKLSRKKYQNLYGTTIHILYKMGEKLWSYFIFLS